MLDSRSRPIDGQGGNQAFEDALVLTRTLEKDLALSDALREFESSRLPRVKRIHDDQRIRYEQRMQGIRVGPHAPEMRAWIEDGV